MPGSRALLTDGRVGDYAKPMPTTTAPQTLHCFTCDGEGQIQVGATSVRTCDLCDGEGVREIEDDVCPEPNCDGETHYSGQRDPHTNEDVEAGPCTHGGFVPPW